MEAELGTPADEVDRRYRVVEDYVFGELEYPVSRTCCWNSTTPQMYEIIMSYNRLQQESGCATPVVFAMEDGGYERFRAHAEALGRAHDWVAWSADEACPQAATVQTDTAAAADHTDWCAL